MQISIKTTSPWVTCINTNTSIPYWYLSTGQIRTGNYARAATLFRRIQTSIPRQLSTQRTYHGNLFMVYAVQQLRVTSEVLSVLSLLEFTRIFLRWACYWVPTIIMSVLNPSFSSPDSPFEDLLSLPDNSSADSDSGSFPLT